jgi:prevent-host-death family protein
MYQVTIHEAKTHLSKLIKKVLSGEEVIIARGKEPLVKLVVISHEGKKRKVGNAKGIIKYMAEDFNVPLDDFKEYMG